MKASRWLLVSRIGVVLGCTLIVAGVALIAGPAVALIGAGVCIACICLFLIDVEDRKEKPK